MLQITERAVSKVRQLMEAESKGGSALRVAVQGGGCSGFQYSMSFEPADGGRDNDVELEFNGLQVRVDPMSHLYLDEVSVDYLDSLTESGFKFHNPKATGTCGCGSSFSA